VIDDPWRDPGASCYTLEDRSLSKRGRVRNISIVERGTPEHNVTPAAREKYCTACGTLAPPDQQTKGSFLLESVLWLLFFAPGFLYAKWRLTTSYEACPKCGSAKIVPAISSAARGALGARAAVGAASSTS
jgi:hypothetical protein